MIPKKKQKTEVKTPILPGRIYFKEISGKKHFAVCLNVMQDSSGVYGTLDPYLLPPSRVREGSDDANTWTLVPEKKDAKSIADHVDAVQAVISAGIKTTVEVVEAVSEIADLIGDLKKPSKK